MYQINLRKGKMNRNTGYKCINIEQYLLPYTYILYFFYFSIYCKSYIIHYYINISQKNVKTILPQYYSQAYLRYHQVPVILYILLDDTSNRLD